MRETLCNNKCENPPDISTRSIKTTKKGDNGCEIAIAMSSQVEAFAVRDLAAEGDQQQHCWDSLANIAETCTNFNPNTNGWITGLAAYEFYQLGFRALNAQGSLHSAFSGDDALPQWCGDSKPSCDSCSGGSGNKCTTGDFSGCDCSSSSQSQPSQSSQPDKPPVTNCATAMAASLITCCGWSPDTQATCQNIIQGCGALVDLQSICQTTINKNQFAGGACLGTTADDPIVRGTPPDDLSNCLNQKFNLNANFKYA
ncbi:hypothetical protein BGZ63DRAFT_434759 [Mariannaea sp. PMI_226]|nr:hypothetical protein BGZ63DRAFT_434759 [Mariannaea sp. PMI_226]